MRRILALAFSLFVFSANAQVCNTPVPWFTNFGSIPIGDIPALGPQCNQLQDSGISAATLSATLTSLQSQINTLSSNLTALTNTVNNINAPVLLNTLTASNSATLSDTTSLTSTYNIYDIVFENVLPVNNSVTMELQVHSGGAFQTTTYVSTIFRANSGGTATQTSTTFIDLTVQIGISNSAPGYSGTVRVVNPSGTTTNKVFVSLLGGLSSGAEIGMAAGWWNGGTGAVDGFQVLMSTGNIASGVIKIYGIKG